MSPGSLRSFFWAPAFAGAPAASFAAFASGDCAIAAPAAAARRGDDEGAFAFLPGGELEPRLEALEFEVSDLRRELSETQERLDFAERLLAGPERVLAVVRYLSA